MVRSIAVQNVETASKSFPKGIHVSPICLLPKNRPGRWRRIAISPLQCNVNDGIIQEMSSLGYTSVDNLASLILSEGRGLKGKIKKTYRMVPIHPKEQYLLGIYWNGAMYVDRMLPLWPTLSHKDLLSFAL